MSNPAFSAGLFDHIISGWSDLFTEEEIKKIKENFVYIGEHKNHYNKNFTRNTKDFRDIIRRKGTHKSQSYHLYKLKDLIELWISYNSWYSSILFIEDKDKIIYHSEAEKVKNKMNEILVAYGVVAI